MLLPVPSALDQGKGLATPGPLGQSGHARQKVKIAGDRPDSFEPDHTLVSPEPRHGETRLPPNVVSPEPAADVASFNQFVVASGVLDIIASVAPMASWVTALPQSRITTTAESDQTQAPASALRSREPEDDFE